ncbi:MAG: hypothetical protein SOZ84_11375 [Treponema sp.]|nr:hypothetical protein [Treponema sp.]
MQEIATKHGMHPNQISQWKSLAIAGMADLFERPNKKSQKVRQQEEIVGVGNNCCGVSEFINH